jgi:hypothetical protein
MAFPQSGKLPLALMVRSSHRSLELGKRLKASQLVCAKEAIS